LRRHRLQHIELPHQKAPDRRDPIEPRQNGLHVAVVHDAGRKPLLDVVELEQGLTEPELVGLVKDDK
jgi:hypothetical protein